VSPAEMKEVFFEKLADLGLRQKVEGGQ